MRHRCKGYFLAFAAGLVGALLVVPDGALGASQARVVRLSFVEGTVMIKRPNSGEWAKAYVNTPIQQGFSLSTASSDSFAEIQFENGSTVRLGASTKVDFTELSLETNGGKVNRLKFDQGYATYHVMPEHGDIYTVQAANVTLTPRSKTEFRTDLDDQGRLRVEVFSGSVRATAGEESKEVGKDKVLTCNTETPQGFTIAHGTVKDDWDKWTEQRDRQAVLTRYDAPVSLDAPLYGWDDLDMYGEWAYFPGFGYGWSPFSPFGWSPYSLGMWNWYPDFGYTWISFEPWGWLPYHYGMWQFDPAFGWFWMPGSFGMWSPALVSWYQGPGWVGWVPRGVAGGAVCAGSSGCITAVPTAAVQNGTPVNTHTIIPVKAAQGRPVTRLDIQPTRLAMLSGTPLPAGTMMPHPQSVLSNRASNSGATTSPSAPPMAAARVAAPGKEIPSGSANSMARSNPYFGRSSSPAPRHLIMGEDATREGALLASGTGGRSLLGRVFGGSNSHPQVAHLGPSLGGRYPVFGKAGAEMPGVPAPMSNGALPSSGSRPHPAPLPPGGPVILPHGGGFYGAGRATMSRSGGFARGGGFTGMSRSGGISTMSIGRSASLSGGAHGGLGGHGGMSSGHR